MQRLQHTANATGASRAETGPLQVGDDWPGVFIRGDNAMWYASVIDTILQGQNTRELPPFTTIAGKGLANLLKSCQASPRPEDLVPGLLEGSLWRHIDGGFYQKVGEGHHTDDMEETVAYLHIWPFEKKLWFRPKSQWEGRFHPASWLDVEEALKTDRAQARQAVEEARTKRRAASNSAS